jgi:hypothetical protein
MVDYMVGAAGASKQWVMIMIIFEVELRFSHPDPVQ